MKIVSGHHIGRNTSTVSRVSYHFSTNSPNHLSEKEETGLSSGLISIAVNSCWWMLTVFHRNNTIGCSSFVNWRWLFTGTNKWKCLIMSVPYHHFRTRICYSWSTLVCMSQFNTELLANCLHWPSSISAVFSIIVIIICRQRSFLRSILTISRHSGFLKLFTK